MNRTRWVLAVLLSLPTTLAAQGGEWPTLSDAGLEYMSRSGFFQVGLSGQLDLEVLHVRDSWAGLVSHEGGEDPLPESHEGCPTCHVGMAFRGDGGVLQAHRLRVFADIFLGDHLYSLVEVRSDRGHAPSDGDVLARVEQAFVRVTNTLGSTGVQVGRFASPFGAYPLRHLTTVDPFLRPPLSYDYRTVMSRDLLPSDATNLLEWKDTPEFFRKPGAPPVWDVPYQWGAMVFSSLGPVDLRMAAMNSAPSSAPEVWGFEWARLEDPSWVIAARTRPTAYLDLGISYNRGPRMEEIVAGSIMPLPGDPQDAEPPSFRDFDQEIVSADVVFSRGPIMLRAEAMIDRWAVPNIVERATEHLYEVEAQWDVFAGVSLAGRLGHIDFRPLDDGLSEASPSGPTDWDNDVTRYEASLRYRFARNTGVLFSLYHQSQEHEVDTDSRFVGLRLWWAF